MKHSSMNLLVVIFVILGLQSGLLADRCPVLWTAIGDHCYQLSESDHVEVEKEICRAKGGKLVSLDTEDGIVIHQKIIEAGIAPVKSTLGKHTKPSKYLCQRLAKLMETVFESSWLGGNEIDPTSGWAWSDGSPFGYAYWREGQPDNHNEPELCIEAVVHRAGVWNDQRCYLGVVSTCKKPATCRHGEALLSGKHYITDWAFYATSSMEGDEAYRSRLNSTSENGEGGWTPKRDDVNPHLSFTFNSPVEVTSVITQGHSSREEWVTQYTVSYHYDDNFQWILDSQGNIMEFDGNTDQNGKVENTLSETGILTKSIRIHPVKHHEAASMRVELYGCLHDRGLQAEPVISGEFFVPDKRMTASSQYDEYHTPDRARIDTVKEGAFGGVLVLCKLFVPSLHYNETGDEYDEYDDL
ncbi:hypothetical protein CAPTEDRAFT_204017 [Capitella teleta]|uniref:C-type lectin domain-containing protein n=1 Tax=Capitella teleta TaxID=283909 RepID=R7TJI9_CAPTE|nr:hypothetical protein CAPTEDRAFT_204017 [Capitella teleta]|eukprot:ELT93667.1 hypothetical protein CAPTEDRAFT_204017 [Capitella teleta]